MVAKNQPRCQKQQVGPVLPPECKAGELQGGAQHALSYRPGLPALGERSACSELHRLEFRWQEGPHLLPLTPWLNPGHQQATSSAKSTDPKAICEW